MASKKTVAEPAIEEVKPEEAPVAEEKPAEDPAVVDEWQVEVEMIVPRKPKGEDPQYYICVNDRRFIVPADGRMQKLPKPIAEVLKDSLEAEAEADDFADRMPKEFT